MYTATSTWDGEFWVLVKIRSAVIIITIIIGQTKNTHKKRKKTRLLLKKILSMKRSHHIASDSA